MEGDEKSRSSFSCWFRRRFRAFGNLGLTITGIVVTVWKYHISSYLLYEVSQCHTCSSKGCLDLGPSQSGLSLRYRQVNLPASAKPLVFSVKYGFGQQEAHLYLGDQL